MIKEPNNMEIPKKADFYFDGGVDEQWALEHYLGKDIDYAEQRYYTLDPLAMSQDFLLVGVRAYRYYMFAAFRYLQSDYAIGEQDVYAALPEGLTTKVNEEPHAFTHLKAYLVGFCDWAIQSYAKFGLEGFEDIYGDVRRKYASLRDLIQLTVPEYIH